MPRAIALSTLILFSALGAGTRPAFAQADQFLKVQRGQIRVVTVATGLMHPWSIRFLPNGDALVTEQSGQLRLIRNGELQAEPVWVSPTPGRDALKTVAVHPRFEDNGFVYVSYPKQRDDGHNTLAVARGVLRSERLVDVEDIFLADAWAEGGNLGGRIDFGPDEKLYVAVGDRDLLCCVDYDDNSLRIMAQQLDNDVGKTLRINDDGSIPQDNPFVGRADANATIFTYGHRNGYGFAVHPQTGAVWQTEIGPMGGDEVNILGSGRNYGWPLVSTGRNYTGTLVSDQPWARPGMDNPRIHWVPSISPSSIMFYTGEKFPEWQNNLFVGALTTRQLQRIAFGQPSQAERREGLLTELNTRIRDVAQSPDGYIYVATELSFVGSQADGTILRLEPVEPNPYSEVSGWADFSSMPHPGNVSSVAVDNQAGRVWIAARCGANDCSGNTTHAPVIGLDMSTGEPFAATGTQQYVWPHGIHVDSDGNVWVTDGRADAGRGLQVIKYAPDGSELMRIGQAGVAGDGPYQFSGPTDVAIAPDGSVYVADGHEAESNNRVMKFSADGEFIMSFGEYGSGPGQFAVPHAIAIDSQGRLFVADRDNGRVQIFDSQGSFIDAWTQFGRPSGIEIGPDDTLYVSDNQSNDARNPGVARGIRIGDARTGVVRAFIPDPEFDRTRAQETMAHGVAVDAAGAVYGAEVWGQSIRKYQLTD